MHDCYTRKKGIVYKNQYHVIWCPKYRRKVLVNGIDQRLKEIIFDIAAEKDIAIKAIEVMPDHIHVFLDLDPRLAIHSVVQTFKGRSSRILRDEYPQLKKRLPCLWTSSYYCCSVGHISEKTVEAYINDQKRSQYSERKSR